MEKIYMDYAATTPVDRKVVLVMDKHWNRSFGNPSSIHSLGVEAKKVVLEARKGIAGFLNAHDREIIFTSGGTEANNLAVFGVVKKIQKTGRKNSDIHIITTKIEHSSILKCFIDFEKDGVKVDYLEVDEKGLINPKDLRKIIKPETILISIGYANGEIGTVQSIKEIIKEIRHKRSFFGRKKVDYPYFHTDASQATQYLNMNVEELGIDLMTLDAQKIYGPKGIGALYLRDNVFIDPIILGGGQEKGIRSGTENVPLIVGFAEAIKIAGIIKEKEVKRLLEMRDKFFGQLKEFVPIAIVNGDLKSRLPNNINISIPGQDGEMLVLRLDETGIICSSTSACDSGSGKSNVVNFIALKSGISKIESEKRAKSTLRFTLGRENKLKDIEFLLKSLQKICK